MVWLMYFRVVMHQSKLRISQYRFCGTSLDGECILQCKSGLQEYTSDLRNFLPYKKTVYVNNYPFHHFLNQVCRWLNIKMLTFHLCFSWIRIVFQNIFTGHVHQCISKVKNPKNIWMKNVSKEAIWQGIHVTHDFETTTCLKHANT